MSRIVPLPCLRVGLDGGAGKREVGKTWEGGDPDEAFTTLSSGPRWVKHLLLSLGGGALSSALIFPSLNSPATISCAGTMDGWVRSSSTEKLVLCNHSLQYFWRKPVGFCFDSVQWWPHSSILDPGWDETPGSCGPVVGLCGASLVSRSPALQFQGLRVFLKYHSGQRGTPPFEEGAWLSEDIYILAQGLFPSRGF